MNFNHILNDIANTESDAFEAKEERRSMLKNMGRTVALTALPLAVSSFFNKASGKTTDEVINALNHLLSLKQIQIAFYQKALTDSTAQFPSATAMAAFTTIANQKQKHADYFAAQIKVMGGTPISPNAKGYDFSLDGMLNTFSSYETLLAVAQVLEDTIVRAYKGQTGMFIKTDMLTNLMNIHAVDARHAAHIRQMRTTAAGGLATVKPWVTLNQSGIANPAFNNAYAGEENVLQAGINLTAITGQSISNVSASEAFDEPLTKQQTLEIVTPFIKQ
jgi:hypothetical protein